MKLSITERAVRYSAAMPTSIQGSNGGNALFNVALALSKGYSLPELEAFPILAQWNQTKAFPPWSDTDLLHKLRDASKTNVPDGYLINSDGRQPGRRTDLRNPPPTIWGNEIQARMDINELVDKAWKRAQWPAFRRPTEEEVQVVAKLRKLPVECVEMARAAGFLWSAKVDGAACFVIREGEHFAQAIRYDGMSFALPGNPRKKTLPGSLSKGFLGWDKLGDPACPVLLVEGAIGLLEAIAAVRAVNADARPGAGWSVLAAISSGSRFANEAFPLPDMTGRRFRILPDQDAGQSGYKAAAAWQDELEARGATTEAYPLPTGCKDLGPVVADAELHLEYLNQLFTI